VNVSVFLFLLFNLCSNQAQAFGSLGHRIVAQLAQEEIGPQTQVFLKPILQLENDRLIDLANWPDLQKSNPLYNHTHVWHYINLEDNQTSPLDYLRGKKTLHATQPNILSAIEEMKKILKDNQKNLKAKREALAFLVHLIGDLHQPLHVGRKKDKGGNTISLKWFGKNTNLHALWDEKLIEMEQLSFTEYSDMLKKYKSSFLPQQLQSLNSEDWAFESFELRKKVYQGIPFLKKQNEYHYYYQQHEDLKKRLTLAGIRLAATLTALAHP
jgi:hypothetical protein